MTEKHEYSAAVRRKGLENTGVTEDVAKKMYNTPERRTLALVEVEHKRQVNDVDTGRTIELVITAFEPSQDENLDAHIRQLMRTMHQNRVLQADDTQLTIENAGDLEPKVEDVIAAQRAHQAGQPHLFDPADEGDDCTVCGEVLEHQLHLVVDDPAVEPDEDPADDSAEDPEPIPA